MSKLPQVGTTIFTVMSKLANDHNAINLSQGFPNFPVDDKLTSILAKKATEDVHQYMPMPGSPALRIEIASMINKVYKRVVHPDSELLITAGATQAIFTAIMALVKEGDEVIVLDPAYDCYDPTIRLSGGTPIHVPLNDSYQPDWEKINAACNEKTRMIVTNNPHNPSGRMWNASDFDALESLMSKNERLLWLSDEVYEFITFESEHISAHHHPNLYARSIITSSFGKTFHITGWKMGYMIAPEALMIEIKKVHQFNVFCVNSVAQSVLTDYLPQVDVTQLGAFYQQKRDLFASLMKESRFELLPCDGTYFQLADYSAISDESDVDFCQRLTTEFGVAAIPVSVFNDPPIDRKHIRFCFAKDDETLIKATEKLCKI
ncbi:MAG: methionine aminotransferase [bacterium]|nr:methionine aminotransferase [bacterium]